MSAARQKNKLRQPKAVPILSHSTAWNRRPSTWRMGGPENDAYPRASQRRAGVHHFRRDREALVARPLFFALDAGLEAAFAAVAGGSTATASISRSPPSRASPEIASVVLAGRFWSDR